MNFHYEKTFGNMKVTCWDTWIDIKYGEVYDKYEIRINLEETHDLRYVLSEILRLRKEHENEL